MDAIQRAFNDSTLVPKGVDKLLGAFKYGFGLLSIFFSIVDVRPSVGFVEILFVSFTV